MEVVVTTGAIRRAKLQSDRHHQQTNTQLFTGQMSFLSSNQQCQSKALNGNVSTQNYQLEIVTNDYMSRFPPYCVPKVIN